MNNSWLLIIFGAATIYFGIQSLRIFPTLFQLLIALITRTVKWPGPRIHDLAPSVSIVRERLGIGYHNLFSDFIWNSSGVIAAFVYSILMLLSSSPLLVGYIRFKSVPGILILSLISFAGARFTSKKALNNIIQVNSILSDLANKVEPREIDRQSAETEYAIEHPLISNSLLKNDNERALDLYYESVKLHQDGIDVRASSLYQEAVRTDPDLHKNAINALSKMVQDCSLHEEGAICYWLGIHSEYLLNLKKAADWYERSIKAFHQIGYHKRESRGHCNLGSIKMRMNDPSGIEEFEKAITLNPKNGIAHLNIGTVYYRISESEDPRYEKALEAFANAIFADPHTYTPLVTSRLRSIGYSWKEDLKEIMQRASYKQQRAALNDFGNLHS